MSEQVMQTVPREESRRELVETVVRQFVDLLIAGGTSVEMITSVTAKVLADSVNAKSEATFMELGSIQRDCMEVMCAWRRDIRFVNQDGEPLHLREGEGRNSFASLCQRVRCKHESSEILKTLLEFGAVSIVPGNLVKSETPTFLLGRAYLGGRLAFDGVLKQLQGFLQVVHRNVCSVSGQNKPKFERACTVSVAIEFEPIFDRLVRNRGQDFIDSIDEWLERNAKRESTSGRYLELGAGAYFIELAGTVTESREGNRSE